MLVENPTRTRDHLTHDLVSAIDLPVVFLVIEVIEHDPAPVSGDQTHVFVALRLEMDDFDEVADAPVSVAVG